MTETPHGEPTGSDPRDPRDPADLAARLADHDYLAAPELATAAFLALRLRRPLFCEGEPGVGKTSLAAALAGVTGGPLVRLQCYEGIDAAQALYDWDFPRQLLAVRGQAAGPGGVSTATDPATDPAGGVYRPEFLLDRPILSAIRASRPGARAVLLVDEIDRADDEFEAFLLEVLDEAAVTIPELGRIAAQAPPVVVVTSNRTREVHDALKRRCLYHWLDLPARDQEIEIVRRRVPQASPALAAAAADVVARLRASPLVKRPGVAETLDFVRALLALGAPGGPAAEDEPTPAAPLDPALVRAALGTLVKTREDLDLLAADPGAPW